MQHNPFSFVAFIAEYFFLATTSNLNCHQYDDLKTAFDCNDNVIVPESWAQQGQ